MSRSPYLEAVKELTASHFATHAHKRTDYETELGVFCCLIQTLDGVQHSRGHAEKVLETVQQFLFRLRAGQTGALTLALQRLEQLALERASSPLPTTGKQP